MLPTSSDSTLRYTRFAIWQLLIIIGIGIWLWLKNQPVAMPDIGLSEQAKFQCISYAPYYHDGLTPFEPTTMITPEQIEQDLRFLSKKFSCVRTYSVGQGLDKVPEIAQKVGIKVMLGAWIGWIKAKNDQEVMLAVKLANQFPDTVKTIIIGNEVLLRHEQPPSVLQDYFDYAHHNTKTPITYADVWEYWLKFKDMQKNVDFVTAHILPYWEDNPVSINQAIEHTTQVMDKLHTEFSKPIFIGETGWPSAGRQRGPSTPSLINEAKYVRGFLAQAFSKGWNYNVIESFDQPWKRDLEGTVGGTWGIYDVNKSPKFSFYNPVAERHDSYLPIMLAVVGALIGLALAWTFRVIKPAQWLASASLGATAMLTGMLQFQYLQAVSRNALEWASLGAVGVASILLVFCMFALLIKRQGAPLKTSLSWLFHFSVIGALINAFLMIYDGRYRDFALVLFGFIVLQWFALMLLGYQEKISSKLNNYFAAGAVIFSIVFLFVEPLNRHAWIWLLAMLGNAWLSLTMAKIAGQNQSPSLAF